MEVNSILRTYLEGVQRPLLCGLEQAGSHKVELFQWAAQSQLFLQIIPIRMGRRSKWIPWAELSHGNVANSSVPGAVTLILQNLLSVRRNEGYSSASCKLQLPLAEKSTPSQLFQRECVYFPKHLKSVTSDSYYTRAAIENSRQQSFCIWSGTWNPLSLHHSWSSDFMPLPLLGS